MTDTALSSAERLRRHLNLLRNTLLESGARRDITGCEVADSLLDARRAASSWRPADLADEAERGDLDHIADDAATPALLCDHINEVRNGLLARGATRDAGGRDLLNALCICWCAAERWRIEHAENLLQLA